MMRLTEVTSSAQWETFITTQPWTPFLQAWAWGEFQHAQGHDVKRFFLQEDDTILLACQLVHEKRRFGMGYWLAARGPVFASEAMPRIREVFHAFLRALSMADLPGRCLFFRVEPVVRLEVGKNITAPRLVRARARNPAATRLLDVTQNEEALFAQLHQKTRYNVRIAEKHGVTVRVGDRPEDFETFVRLTHETSERDQFVSRDDGYLRATFEALAPTGFVRLRLAEADGVPLAANMEIAYGDTATYLYGASSSQNRQMMAPYALQWGAIQAAKQEGYACYDLWGCNPTMQSSAYFKKSWEGISRFKQGWGGELVELMGTWDLPVYRLPYLIAFPEAVWRS